MLILAHTTCKLFDTIREQNKTNRVQLNRDNLAKPKEYANWQLWFKAANFNAQCQYNAMVEPRGIMHIS